MALLRQLGQALAEFCRALDTIFWFFGQKPLEQ
jgi:hypothetical protein